MDPILEEFFENFKSYNRYNGNVIIHPGLPNQFIELKENFVRALENDLKMKIRMALSGIDELDPSTKFAIMMLTDSY